MNRRQRLWGRHQITRLAIVGLLALSLAAGCASTTSQTPNPLYTGAGLGALLGGGLGAAINHRSPGKGAAIGALLGAAGGGLAGAAYNSANPSYPQQQGYYQQPPQQQPYYGSPPPASAPGYSYNAPPSGYYN